MLDFIRGNSGSFLTKIIFGVIILVFIFWGVGSYTSIGNHSVATVNGEQISTAEFHNVINNALRSIDSSDFRGDADSFNNFKRSHLDRMIATMLIKQKAEELGIFVTPQELQYVITSEAAFLDEQGKFDKNRYVAVLKQGQISPGEFEQQIMNQLLMQKVLNYVAMSVAVTEEEVHNYYKFIREERVADYVLFPLTDYAGKAQPSKEEIEAYYAAEKGRFTLPARVEYDYIQLSPAILANSYTIDDAAVKAEYDAHPQDYTNPAEYEVRIIVLDVPKEAGEQAARDIGQAIMDRLAGGEKFADVAAEVSVAPEAKTNGGMLGWIKENELQPDIAQLLSSMNVGDHSPVQQMQDSWYIFMLENKKEAEQIAFDTVRDDIKKALANRKGEEAYQTLQTKADEGLRDGLDFDKLSTELGVPKLNTGLVPVDQASVLLGLTTESMDMLMHTQPGKAAPAPLETQEGIVLVFVKDSKPQETPALEEVEKEVVDILVKDKSFTLAEADAAACLSAIKENNAQLPAQYQGNMASSRKINRLTPQFNPLSGDASALVSALFSEAQNVWLDKAYALDQGVVVARVKSIIEASDAEWDATSDLLTKAMLESKREMFIQAFMEELNARAKIEVNTTVLDTLSFT